MKFSAREDLEAPIDQVFAEVSDFHRFERSALRRGAELQRIDTLDQPGVGMGWDVAFRFRGKPRQVTSRITRFDPPSVMALSGDSPSLEGDLVIDLVALSRGHTRLSLALTIAPRSMQGRLMVQSIKLARGAFTRRFKTAVADFARHVEARAAGGA